MELPKQQTRNHGKVADEQSKRKHVLPQNDNMDESSLFSPLSPLLTSAPLERSESENEVKFANLVADPKIKISYKRSTVVHKNVLNDTPQKDIVFMVKTSAGCSTHALRSTRPPSLTASLEQQPKSVNGVPIVVEACLQYFNTSATDCEGLFRVPGNYALVEQMWDHMERHPYARISTNCVTVFMRKHPEFTAHEVSSFFKRFIGSMRGCKSLITYNCYAPLVDLIKQKYPTHLITEKYKHIIGQLLVSERHVLLGRLCAFLLDFSQHAAKTRMNCAALAVCFAHLMHAPPKTYKQKKHNHTVSVAPKAFKWRWPKKRKIRSLSYGNTSIAQLKQLKQLKEEAAKAKSIVLIIEALITHAHPVFFPSFFSTALGIYLKNTGTELMCDYKA